MGPSSAFTHKRKAAIRASGFTLLELLVVVVIIGLLAAYVGPKYFSHIGKSEVAVAKAQVTAFEKAIDAYRVDVGQFPSNEDGLAALMLNTHNSPKWNGPYMQKAIPLDPWGHAYEYHANVKDKDYEIVSLGKDGQAGGEGENADVSN